MRILAINQPIISTNKNKQLPPYIPYTTNSPPSSPIPPFMGAYDKPYVPFIGGLALGSIASLMITDFIYRRAIQSWYEIQLRKATSR